MLEQHGEGVVVSIRCCSPVAECSLLVVVVGDTVEVPRLELSAQPFETCTLQDTHKGDCMRVDTRGLGWDDAWGVRRPTLLSQLAVAMSVGVTRVHPA